MDTVRLITFGGRLRDARKAAGLTQKQLSARSGVSQSMLSELETGEAEGSTHVAQLAAALNVNALWLAEGRGRRTRETLVTDGQDLYPEDAIFPTRPAQPVPVFGRSMSDVPDNPRREGVPAVLSVEYAFVATTDPAAFLVRVEGDSMAPKYEEGQYALVEPGTEIDIEDDVLLRLTDGRTLLRRLASRRNVIRLSTLNPSAAAITVKPEEIVWMYYVAHPVPAKKIRTRL